MAKQALALWALYFALPYAAFCGLIQISDYFAFVLSFQILQPVVTRLIWFLWLGGPPMLLLLDQRDGLTPYLLGTLCVSVGSWFVVRGVLADEEVTVSVVLTLALWIGFGALTYLPLI